MAPRPDGPRPGSESVPPEVSGVGPPGGGVVPGSSGACPGVRRVATGRLKARREGSEAAPGTQPAAPPLESDAPIDGVYHNRTRRLALTAAEAPLSARGAPNVLRAVAGRPAGAGSRTRGVAPGASDAAFQEPEAAFGARAAGFDRRELSRRPRSRIPRAESATAEQGLNGHRSHPKTVAPGTLIRTSESTETRGPVTRVDQRLACISAMHENFGSFVFP